MGVKLKRSEKDIRRVKLMGVRTAEETLIIRTVNFTVYSFWIEYKNGTTETVEVSPQDPHDSFGAEKRLFDTLMAYSNKEPAREAEAPPTPVSVGSSSVLDELKKLKELFDDGVIPENLYEEKRAELLDQLSNCGTPNIAKKKDVMIRFPVWSGQMFNNKCYVYNKATNEVIVQCKQGETATFEIDQPLDIYIVVKGSFGQPEATVKPGDRYNVGYRGFGRVYLEKVDTLS